MTAKLDTLPKAFIWRRLHSLTGLWLVLFLLEHLITNSQAALLLGDSGAGFVHMVNAIHNLPYLTVIEVTVLGVPILIHMVWGVRYAITAKFNSMRSDGSKPHLAYSRNKAYTWQRITSWILVVLLILHIVKFRFLEYPHSANVGTQNPKYLVTITMDPGLYTVAKRLGVELVDDKSKWMVSKDEIASSRALEETAKIIREKQSTQLSKQDEVILQTSQNYLEKVALSDALLKMPLKKGEAIAISPTFGTASLLSVRDTFKSWMWIGVYTVFVLSACFHAFNGLWTSMLTWGWVIKSSAQTGARKVAITLMIVIAFLGLAAIWGTYFLNLRH